MLGTYLKIFFSLWTDEEKKKKTKEGRCGSANVINTRGRHPRSKRRGWSFFAFIMGILTKKYVINQSHNFCNIRRL